MVGTDRKGVHSGSEKISSAFSELLNENSGSTSLLNLRNEYEKRLLTFQASTYYAKPPCLSPLFCARFGWKNADTDMLVCTGCSSALAITLNSSLSANTYDKLCRAYRNKIVSCHSPSCAYRLSSIEELESSETEMEEVAMTSTTDLDQTSLNVPVYMSQVLPEDSIRLMEHPKPATILRQNAKKISDTIRSTLCTLNANNILDGASTSSWTLPKLQVPPRIQHMNSGKELSKCVGCDNESILALALLGWRTIPNMSSDKTVPALSFGCPCCLSIMDLRLELDTADASEDDDDDDADRLNKRQRTSSRNLNPLEAHRHYCPFRVGFPDKAGESNPIWKIVLKRLQEESQVTESANIEELSTETEMKGLDESVDNVRRILRAGIATRSIDLVTL